ncbi:MAG: hypothetical protein RL394_454 [Bacteroidota bacterium]|jgi:hypothetical protein
MRDKNKFPLVNAINLTFITILLLSCNYSIAQDQNKIKFPDRTLGFSTGISQHLSQSLVGGYLGLNHEVNLSKKIKLHHNLIFSLHKGKDNTHEGILSNALSMTTMPPDFNSVPLKFITIGIQTFSGASTSFFSGKLIIGAGPLLRYQNTSKPEKYEFIAITRPTTRFDGIFLYRAYYLINSIRPHTFAAGGLVFLDVKLVKVKSIETKASFLYQFDSQGDKLFSAGIKLIKPYKKTS